MKYILLFSFLTGAVAQNYDWDNEKSRGRRSSEKMENMIVWRLTDDLDLTTDQAEKFFPKHREHRANIEELRQKIENLSEESWENFDNINSKEITKIIKECSKLNLKTKFEELGLRKTNFHKFRKLTFFYLGV